MTRDPAVLDRGLLLLLSVLAAVTVGNLYLAQPLLAEIARSFHASSASAGAVVTFAQVGYGSGVLLLVPLGDLVERRRLILALLGAVVAALAFAAVAPTVGLLAAASFLIGLATVVPQVVIPYAASLAPAARRASVLGTVQSGLLLGILLARTFSGMLGAAVGWRGVFWAGGALCAVLAIAVAALFPSQRSAAAMSYPRALVSMLALLRESPRLARVSLASALNFAVFTSFWTTLPFLLEASYGRGAAAAGMFGLVGAAGALSASVAGRASDRYGVRVAQVASLVVTAISFAPFWPGAHSMLALIAAVAIMDAGVQATHIACQAEALQVPAEARSRVNGLYMFLRFLGGALGSALGVWCWSRWGWSGFCVSGAVCAAASFVPLIGGKRA